MTAPKREHAERGGDGVPADRSAGAGAGDGPAPGGRASSGVSANERRASSLELDPAAFDELARAFGGLTADYFGRSAEGPVLRATSAEALAAAFDRALPTEGEPLDRLVDDCRALLGASRDNGHPRMFGYVTSPPTPVGAYATLLGAALNQNVTSWRSAPAATTIERTVVRWLAELVGYAGEAAGGRACGGLLTSGGSMANLTALLIALRVNASGGDPGGFARRGLWGSGPPATLYVSDQVHFSVPKAAEVLGIGHEQVREIPCGGDFRLDVRALGEAIERDARAGLRPFCVVASAGTVATGAVDPLADVARVAREHGLWLHVDGAYGALASADPSKRPLFAGLELADSVSLDPHKWLYAPIDCGCLLVRDPANARAAFGGGGGHYVKVFEQHPDEAFAFWDYGIELSRPFRALKVWLMLRYYGAARVAAAIAHDCALAAHFAERVSASDDFELLAPVTLGVCCFRYAPRAARESLGRGDEAARAAENERLDALNERALLRVQRGGRAYLSNADLRGRFALRASIVNYRTTPEDVELTLDAVRDAAREG